MEPQDKDGPHRTLNRNNKVFISAVSREFDGIREQIAQALLACDIQPVFQRDFPLSDKSIGQKLCKIVASCDAMIHIAGECFGASPRNQKPNEELVSYTQLEYQIAKKLGIPVYVFITQPGFPFVPSKDFPEPPAGEESAKVAAQQRHRNFLMGKLAGEAAGNGANQDYSKVKNPKEIDQQVRALRIRIEKLEKELTLVDEKLDRVASEIRNQLGEVVIALDKSIRAVGESVSTSAKATHKKLLHLLGGVGVVGLGLGIGILLQHRNATTQRELSTFTAQSTSQTVRSTGEKLEQHQTNEADRVVSTLSKQIASIHESPPPSPILRTTPVATVLDPVGLKEIGPAPLSLASIAKPIVVVSAPGYEVQWVETRSYADKDASIQLRAAKVPAKEHFENTLLGARLIWIESGSFTMGAQPEELGSNSTERPSFTVHIRNGFWMAATEVTNRQAALFLPRFGPASINSPTLPAIGMTWGEAAEYCRQLTKFETAARRIPYGWNYALPTEAEWEFACRAGTQTAFFSGQDETTVYDFAWTRENSNGVLHHAGTRKPNNWGLHDMLGNAAEWCYDWFGSYPAKTSDDPPGPARGLQRSVRGGDIAGLTIKSCRSTSRDRRSPETPSQYIGFRIVLRESPESIQ